MRNISINYDSVFILKTKNSHGLGWSWELSF